MTIPTPEFTWHGRISSGVVTSEPKLGAVIRGRTKDVDDYVYVLEWKHATDTEKGQLFAEFNAAKGQAGATTYTPVDTGTPTTVQFMEGALVCEPAGKHWRMGCVFVKVAEPY